MSDIEEAVRAAQANWDTSGGREQSVPLVIMNKTQVQKLNVKFTEHSGGFLHFFEPLFSIVKIRR